FTLVELLLALAITGLVSAAVAAMLMAVSYGTSSKRDLHSVVVKSRVVDARIASAIRGSRAILETGTDYLVLWTGDLNPNGTLDAPDLSEIRLIERDGASDTLSSYGFPSNWTQGQIDAANVTYQLTGNPPGFFQSATAAAKTAGSFQPTLWGSDVTSISFALDGVAPDSTMLVSYRLALGAGDLSETVVGSASARYGTVNPN
ncbi:MAG: hypothetical protein KJ749_13850, partial [Planctomycetes bacterium]|nr:hypothetical protein [Planctomycetota bacterium]